MSTSGKLLELTPGANDLSAIVSFDQSHFPRPWSAFEWKAMEPQHYLLYAWQNTQLEAFALFHLVVGDETAHLLKISVLPEHRGKGLVHKFWTEIRQKLKTLGVSAIYLEVETTNLSAIKFYQKVGFLPLREIKAFYSEGANALTMSLTL